MLHWRQTDSSRIQLPTETPPQLMPPTKLPARDSRRGFSLFEPMTEMGLVPFPHWDIFALSESFRAAAALYTALALLAAGTEELLARSLLAAFCSAEVRLDACWPGGETDVCRAERSKGDCWPFIVLVFPEDDDGNKGKCETSAVSSPSVSTSVESRKRGRLLESLEAVESQLNESCLRLEDLRAYEEVAPKPTGVLMGVDSLVDR